ncbi:hypothetical protein EB001_11540 [bacterium]|nr:hypothetical protein [bacterium]
MKPVVYYVGPACVVDRGDHSIVLLEFVSNHPTLGMEYDICTSRVISPPDKDGCFETKNTLYKPIEFSFTPLKFVTEISA